MVLLTQKFNRDFLGQNAGENRTSAHSNATPANKTESSTKPEFRREVLSMRPCYVESERQTEFKHCQENCYFGHFIYSPGIPEN